MAYNYDVAVLTAAAAAASGGNSSSGGSGAGGAALNLTRVTGSDQAPQDPVEAVVDLPGMQVGGRRTRGGAGGAVIKLMFMPMGRGGRSRCCAIPDVGWEHGA